MEHETGNIYVTGFSNESLYKTKSNYLGIERYSWERLKGSNYKLESLFCFLTTKYLPNFTLCTIIEGLVCLIIFLLLSYRDKICVYDKHPTDG